MHVQRISDHLPPSTLHSLSAHRVSIRGVFQNRMLFVNKTRAHAPITGNETMSFKSGNRPSFPCICSMESPGGKTFISPTANVQDGNITGTVLCGERAVERHLYVSAVIMGFALLRPPAVPLWLQKGDVKVREWRVRTGDGLVSSSPFQVSPSDERRSRC